MLNLVSEHFHDRSSLGVFVSLQDVCQMPSFLEQDPHIQITAAGKCFGKRERSGQKLGEFLKM